MHFTRVNGINLAYYVYGHGEPVGDPVLMIQGIGGRAADWASAPELARVLLDFLD